MTLDKSPKLVISDIIHKESRLRYLMINLIPITSGREHQTSISSHSQQYICNYNDTKHDDINKYTHKTFNSVKKVNEIKMHRQRQT